MNRNITLYPWFKFFQSLLFWQAVWFLYFQSKLSASEAILLYALFEVSTTILEVPSGYASDRLGRRVTLIVAALCGVCAASLQIVAETFWTFAVAQVFLGGFMALSSGTDNALLYESLRAEHRTEDTEAEELRAWRYGFIALSLSAVTGGVLARLDFALVYAASAMSFVCATVIAWRFVEPAHTETTRGATADVAVLRNAFAKPVLLWLFVLFLLTHIYSHLPFVFGQPFILKALEPLGLSDATPIVSGAVVTTMMLLSLLASLAASPLRRRLGLGLVLLAAFSLQILISAAMALSGSAFVIAILLLRMVPSSFLGPFITARIQPELPDTVRATFVSLKSLTGRLLFAGTLAVSSLAAGPAEELSLSAISTVLIWYVCAGVVFLVALALTRRKATIDT